MTEEQKKFKILKRTSYEEQISQESKVATNYTFLFGLSALATILSFSNASQQDFSSTARMVETGIGLLNTGFSAYGLKNLMQAISRKTMLEGKVEDINVELEMPEKEERRGMPRWQLILKIL